LTHFFFWMNRNDVPEDYLSGFPWHPHRGIETITYVLAGTVEPGDSMGNRGAIAAGDVQWKTAGGGIIHQEMPSHSGICQIAQDPSVQSSHGVGMLCSGAKFSYGSSVGLADERDAKKSRNREGLWQAACFAEVVVHGSCLVVAWCGASISARSRPDSVIGVTQTIIVGRDASISRDHSQGMVL